MKPLHSPFLALLVAAATLAAPAASAQDPASVDIDLRRSDIDTTKLEVYIRANGSGFGQVLSGLTFTLRWATTSPATLGTRVNACPDGIPIGPTPVVVNPDVNGTPTGYDYLSYNGFALTLLDEVGCALPADEWFLVMTVPVLNDTGCTEFQIVNDDFTDSPGNSRDYFVSLGGLDRTGIIEPTPVLMGACAPDCEGVPGGPALPGTSCDDGQPGSENDTWTAECICIGSTAVPNVNDGSSGVLISPNPTTGAVVVRTLSPSSDRVFLRVFDALGALIDLPTGAHRISPGAWSIDLSNADAGLYFVELTSADGQRVVERLMKY